MLILGYNNVCLSASNNRHPSGFARSPHTPFSSFANLTYTVLTVQRACIASLWILFTIRDGFNFQFHTNKYWTEFHQKFIGFIYSVSSSADKGRQTRRRSRERESEQTGWSVINIYMNRLSDPMNIIVCLNQSPPVFILIHPGRTVVFEPRRGPLY